MSLTLLQRRTTLVGATLAGLTLVVFWPSCWNDFVNFDDPQYATDNPRIEAGLTWASIRWALTTTHAANWHPLTWLSLQLDGTVYGIRPFGFHLTNVLLHAACTVLLFAFLVNVTGARWRSASVAALFAVHPLHVESVAWVAERKDVLSTFFWMLTMLAYSWYARRPGWRRSCVVTGLFALGLLAKPMLVTLPFVLLLLDYWPLRRCESWRQLVVEKLPLFALVLASCAVTWYVQRKGGAMVPIEHYGVGVRVANAVLSYAVYLQKMIWPFDLAVFYPHPGVAMPAAPVVVAGLMLTSLTGLLIWGGKRWPYLRVGWLWYLGTLVPVIGLVQVGVQGLADRYTYIPLIGVFIVLVWGCADLAAWGAVSRFVVAGGTLLVLAACVVAAHRQMTYWHDSVALFEHAVEVTGPDATSYGNLAQGWVERGRFEEAAAYCRAALQLRPHDFLAHLILGTALEKQGNLKEALGHYQEAVRLAPDAYRPHFNLGLALEKLGQPAAALPELQQAVRLAPEDYLTHLGFGAALEKAGNHRDALYHYQEALTLRPSSARAHFQLGGLLQRQQQFAEALDHFFEALRLDPEFPRVHYNIGTILAGRGKLESARTHFTEAIRLEPGFAPAYFNLGTALKEERRSEESLTNFRRAVELEPRSLLFRLTLASMLTQVGQTEEAMRQNEEALKLEPRWPWNVARTAWSLATHPNSARRKEAQAVALAEQACQATKFQQPDLVDTLGAAYAAAGRFDLAVTTAQKALEIAQSNNQRELVSSIRNRLTLYRERKAFRDPSLH